MKKILKHPLVLALGGVIISLYIRCVYYSSRVRREMHPQSAPYLSGEQNAIFVFWHSRLLMMPMINPRKRKMHVLISHHRDGELIALAMHCFGFGTVRGSTSRGGVRAAGEGLSVLEAGDNLTITPDGPRGPTEKATLGTVQLARISGRPVIAVSYSSSRHKRLNSWDRFMVAWPFGRLVYSAAEPLYVPPDMDDAGLEAFRAEVEKRLLAAGEQADALAGAAA